MLKKFVFCASTQLIVGQLVDETVPITILYATQTGNAELLAESLFLQLLAARIPARLISLENYSHRDIGSEQIVLFILSKTGNGNVPDDAQGMYEYLQSQHLRLSGLLYSVLALGDRRYSYFCQAGRDFDVLLQAAGANRLTPRVDCDVDFGKSAQHWMMLVLQYCQSVPVDRVNKSNLRKMPHA